MEKTVMVELTLMQVANQLVHCHIIYPVKQGVKWHTIYVCSDHERHKRLFVIPVKLLVEQLRLVGNNYINKSVRTKNLVTGKIVVVNEMMGPLSPVK